MCLDKRVATLVERAPGFFGLKLCSGVLTAPYRREEGAFVSVQASDSPGHKALLSPWGPKVCAALGPLQGAMPENMGFSTDNPEYTVLL